MKRLLAMLCVAVMVITAGGVLPVTAETEWRTISLAFEVDKPTPGAGEIVTVSIVVDGLGEDDYWNLLEFEIGYDEDVMEPVKYINEYEEESEYMTGAALRTGWIASVSFTDYNGDTMNPIKGAVISEVKQTSNGEVLRLFFRVKETAEEGEIINLIPEIKDFSQSVVDEDKTAESVPLTPTGKDVVQLEVSKPVLPETCPLSFTADKQTVVAGDTVRLTLNMDMLPDGTYWNLLDFQVQYDPDQLEAVQQDRSEYTLGAALAAGSAMVSVSFTDYNNQLLVPILGSIISTANQSDSGEVLSLYFRVKEGVQPGDTLLLQPELQRLVQSVVEDQRPTMVELASAGKTDLSLIVAEKEIEDVITLKSAPTKTEYAHGEALDLSGAQLLVTHGDGSTSTVDITEDMISGYDAHKAGLQTVTVTYEGETFTFDVTVSPAFMKGDLDGSKTVTAEDALVALQGATGKLTLRDTQVLAGDVAENDGKVTANDALVILQYATKKITAFPDF